MNITGTKLKGCFVIEPQVFRDGRGYFFETFNEEKFERLTGYPGRFVQDNESSSSYGVVRGLHFQKGAYAQAKLLRVLSGEILDVAVDLRPDSPTYGQWISEILSGENKKQLYIPRGFGHGFSVLSPEAIVAYKCDNFYHKESEGGLRYNDAHLNIDWKIPAADIILSEKDKEWPLFSPEVNTL